MCHLEPVFISQALSLGSRTGHPQRCSTAAWCEAGRHWASALSALDQNGKVTALIMISLCFCKFTSNTSDNSWSWQWSKFVNVVLGICFRYVSAKGCFVSVCETLVCHIFEETTWSSCFMISISASIKCEGRQLWRISSLASQGFGHGNSWMPWSFLLIYTTTCYSTTLKWPKTVVLRPAISHLSTASPSTCVWRQKLSDAPISPEKTRNASQKKRNAELHTKLTSTRAHQGTQPTTRRWGWAFWGSSLPVTRYQQTRYGEGSSLTS